MRPAQPTARIPRRRRGLIDAVGLGLWASGLLWLLSHHVFVPEGEFGPTHRPADAWMLMAHGAFGFAALWVFGLLWGVHVPHGWRQGRRRATGAALFAGLALLIGTGWTLYYCGDETLRPVVSTAHWAIGLAAPALLLLHRKRRTTPLREGRGPGA
jgi:hypothetical protein